MEVKARDNPLATDTTHTHQVKLTINDSVGNVPTKTKPIVTRNCPRKVFGSVGSMFIIVLLLSLAGTGIGVWQVYQSISSGPIDLMAQQIKMLTVQSLSTTLDSYFGNMERSVTEMASAITYGASPYFFDPRPNLTYANSFVWSAMQASIASNNSNVWIVNVMIGRNNAVGYSYSGTPNTFSWFGTWSYGNQTGGLANWETRRYKELVNQSTGEVNYGPKANFSAINGTNWPGLFDMSFNGSPHVWYPQSGKRIDSIFPEMGVEFCFIRAFYARGFPCIASSTITSKFIIDIIKTIDVKGGVMYLADDDGYLFAVSRGLPVYNATTPTGNLTYLQYHYSTYPTNDSTISDSGTEVLKLYGSFKNIPNAITVTALLVNNIPYTMATTTHSRYNLNLHIVMMIPEKSFKGFTADVRTMIAWVVSVMILGVGVLSVLLVLVLITIPINREIRKLNSWVNADERDPSSLFYKPSRTSIERKYPQAREEVTEPSQISRALSYVEASGDEKSGAQKLWMRLKRGVNFLGKRFAPYEVRELRAASQTSRNAMKSFSAYIPRSVVRTLVDQKEVAKPNMVNRELSIYFSDIEDYTGIVTAFKNDSALINEMINEYVGEMTVVLERNKGTVDKWIGDGIMVFWNAPLPIKNHPYWAVKASFQCERRLEYLMREWSVRGFPAVRIRHGFHLGEACVGNIGGEGRMSFTALGENVNIAARIESLNKRYGTYRLCSEDMYQQISGHFLCRLMEMVAVKGTTTLIKVYEIVNFLEACTEEDRQRVAMYNDATEAFITGRDGWNYSLNIYLQYKERYATQKKDVGLELMIRQCRSMIQNPPESWTGGLILDEK